MDGYFICIFFRIISWLAVSFRLSDASSLGCTTCRVAAADPRSRWVGMRRKSERRNVAGCRRGIPVRECCPLHVAPVLKLTFSRTLGGTGSARDDKKPNPFASLCSFGWRKDVCLNSNTRQLIGTKTSRRILSHHSDPGGFYKSQP